MLDDSVLYTCRRLEGAEELPYQFGSAALSQEPTGRTLLTQALTGSREAPSSATGTAPTLPSPCGTEPRALETLSSPCQG